MAWATSVGAHWNKIEAEYNAEWAKLAYLDGPGYTAWDRIEAKFDLRHKYFSGSSSHGVQNSIEKAPAQSCSSHFISSMAESNQEHNSHMAETAREIRESCARILKLLQEEMEATELTSDAVPNLAEILPSVDGIDEHSVTDESVQVKNLIMTSVSPSIDFNGGIVDLPTATTNKFIEKPQPLDDRKSDVKSTFADSFHFERLIVDSVVKRDYCGKETPLDMDNKRESSPIIISQGGFKPFIHLSDPPNIVPLPPPPLAPPWLHDSVYPISLNSPLQTIEINTYDCFQLDHEVLIGTSSQFGCPIAPVVDFGIRASDDHTFLPHTYHLFAEMPMRTTFFCNVALFQFMNLNLTFDSVLFSYNTFESLILGTKDIAFLVQNDSAISELNLNRPPKKPQYHGYHIKDARGMTDSTQLFIPKIIPSQFNVNLNEHLLAFMCLQFKTESWHQHLFNENVPNIKDLMVEDVEEESNLTIQFLMDFLSYAFISKCYVVGAIPFIYAVYDHLRRIIGCGYVSRVLISKKRSFLSCLMFVLSQSVLNSSFSWNSHQSSWFYALNNQGNLWDDYDLTSAYSLGNIKGAPICKCLNGFKLMFLHEWKRVEWSDACVKTHWQLKYWKQYQSKLAKQIISRKTSSSLKGALGIWSAWSGALEHNYHIHLFISTVFTLEQHYAYLVNVVSSSIKHPIFSLLSNNSWLPRFCYDYVLGSAVSSTLPYVSIGQQYIIFQDNATKHMQMGQQWNSSGALFKSTQFKPWDPGIF